MILGDCKEKMIHLLIPEILSNLPIAHSLSRNLTKASRVFPFVIAFFLSITLSTSVLIQSGQYLMIHISACATNHHSKTFTSIYLWVFLLVQHIERANNHHIDHKSIFICK